jgi:hypothetical protein
MGASLSCCRSEVGVGLPDRAPSKDPLPEAMMGEPREWSSFECGVLSVSVRDEVDAVDESELFDTLADAEGLEAPEAGEGARTG